MNRNPWQLRLCVLVAALIFISASFLSAQDAPSGGKTTSTKPNNSSATTPSNSTAKPAAKSPSKSSPARNTSTRATQGAPESIEGKWWTSGNDFGASEVIFSQNGASVTAVIHYADGRNGSLTGTMSGKRLQHSWTNSSGEAGSGWLELSWNNFLGGPWHNQKVRDGSWTLMRVEGKWCFGGSRSRIRTVTHNAQGEMLSVTEDGSRDGGRLEGPYLFLESDMSTIKGAMNFRSNRVEWSTGFFWTWCGRN
ncbi:MAG: hypothetical protein AABM67_03985 [Acidobacteriota bacterium]